MRFLPTFTLLIIYSNAIGQTTLSAKKALTLYPGTYIDTEARYTDPSGINVIIQNSAPKWGTPLLNSARKEQGYSSLIFFNRIINEANDPIELTIDLDQSLLRRFLKALTLAIGTETNHQFKISTRP